MMEAMTLNDVCPHCKMNIKERNPSGTCDHLHYPESCPECVRIKEDLHRQMYAPLQVECFQLINISFLRLELAILCRECSSKDRCPNCRIAKIMKYLGDPGVCASEMKM